MDINNIQPKESEEKPKKRKYIKYTTEEEREEARKNYNRNGMINFYKKHPDKVKAKSNEYYKKNKGKILRQLQQKRLAKGITPKKGRKKKYTTDEERKEAKKEYMKRYKEKQATKKEMMKTEARKIMDRVNKRYAELLFCKKHVDYTIKEKNLGIEIVSLKVGQHILI